MRTFGALTAVLALLVACQPSETPRPSLAAPASVAPASASVAPSQAPSVSAAACDPGVVCRGPLAAGDYVSDGTGARLGFTLAGEGWSGLPETPGVGFGLLSAAFPDAAISALAFVGRYFTDGCDPDVGTSTIGASPAEFMAMLTARPGVTASEPAEVLIGGRPALQVDLTTDVEGDCAATGAEEVSVWPLPVGGPFDLYDQEQARIIAVDGGSATVILIAEARMEDIATTGTAADEYDEFMALFTELLDTMTISPLPD
jgi:hypothetical protein